MAKSTLNTRIGIMDEGTRDGTECNIYDQSEYSSVNTKVKNIPNTAIQQHYIGGDS